MKNDNSTNKKTEVQVFELVKSDSLVDLTKEYAELTLDSFLQDETLKSIPGVNTIYSVFKIGKGIDNYLFAKKLIRFLEELSTISSTEREAFAKKIETEEKTQKNVGESIIVLLNHADSVDKAKMLGQLYTACIKGSIDYAMLKRLCFIVNRTFLHDIEELKKYADGEKIPNISLEGLYNVGLLSFTGINGGTVDGSGAVLYGLSEVGKKLLSSLR